MALPADSAPGFRVTGPVHIWTRTYTVYGATTTSSPGGLYYLGTCEIQPQAKVTRTSIPVKNDLGGKLLPSQTVYQGQMAQIALALSRWSLDGLNALKATGLLGIQGGIDRNLAIGSLEFYQHTFELWFTHHFYNWTTPATGANAITPGRYWRNCKLVDEEDKDYGSTAWNKLLKIEAYTGPICTTGVWSRVLYSEDPADFPTDVRTPVC